MATIQEQLIEKGVKKGLEQGLEKGLAQGVKKGLEQGLEKGLAQGQRATLYKQLQRKFGDRAEAVKGRIDAAAPAEVDTWLDRILFATTLEEVFTE
ncbi:MAG: hypothetical protein IPK82_07780 [Polyangiaceae bacterium]|nr:hypothetical protein [Polyangiaceae bacterium]